MAEPNFRYLDAKPVEASAQQAQLLEAIFREKRGLAAGIAQAGQAIGRGITEAGRKRHELRLQERAQTQQLEVEERRQNAARDLLRERLALQQKDEEAARPWKKSLGEQIGVPGMEDMPLSVIDDVINYRAREQELQAARDKLAGSTQNRAAMVAGLREQIAGLADSKLQTELGYLLDDLEKRPLGGPAFERQFNAIADKAAGITRLSTGQVEVNPPAVREQAAPSSPLVRVGGVVGGEQVGAQRGPGDAAPAAAAPEGEKKPAAEKPKEGGAQAQAGAPPPLDFRGMGQWDVYRQALLAKQRGYPVDQILAAVEAAGLPLNTPIDGLVRPQAPPMSPMGPGPAAGPPRQPLRRAAAPDLEWP